MCAMIDQSSWIKGTVDFHLPQGYIFYYRDLEHTIQYLLRPRAYADYLVFVPKYKLEQEYNQVCTDMHTGD